MEIAIISTSGIYPLHIGGPANVGYFLAKELGNLGHRITLFIRVKNKDEYAIANKSIIFNNLKNVKFVPIIIDYTKLASLNPINFLIKTLEISHQFSKENYDVILYNSPPVDISLLIPIISRIKDIRQFMIFHGYGGLVDNNNFIGRALIKVQKSFFCRSVIVSNYIRNIPMCFGIPENKISTIYNGIDIDEFSKNQSQFELPGYPRLLHVGVLEDRKGVNVLLKAFSLLLASSPSAYLYLIGDGRERSKLERLAVKLNINSHTRFAGFVNRNDLLGYYRSCDLFVMPSFNEAFGITLLECMASKKMAIVSDAPGGPREIAENGARCYMFESGNHVSLFNQINILLNSSRSDQDEIIAHNYEFVKNNYTWKSAAIAYSKMFKETK